ncbi:MAG: helix-turn-helix transcriptional regulator [Achromobacter sp.]|uniref:helix-turn-helix transcriptional regulator n=1 Tax=Achromobacter sp. TaxID=134375 RepID=UPI003D0038C1
MKTYSMTQPRSLPGQPRRFQAPDFEALIEAAGDLIYTLDFKGCFTYLNQASEQVLGYEPCALLGRPFTEILTAESALVATRHYHQGLLGQERTPFFEVEARRPDGGVVHLEVRAGALVRDGEMVGRQGIARDINAIKALQTLVTEKSQRVTLLEERTRIAMAMYARIAELVYADPGAGPAGGEMLQEVQHAFDQLAAQKHGLSVADLRILGLLAQGHSNSEIADIICRSPHTVKDSVKKIMQRLNAKRRAEAVACAIKLGLIAPPS